jgi:ACS family tartrate transporter-like MFS transporter
MPFDSKEFPPADQKQDGLSDVAKRARARITWRITPYVFLLYIIAFLDRVNVSFAALEMTNDLGFTPEIIGFGAGIFFVGYLLLSVPGSILFEKGSARNWIARCMICWGTVATLMGCIYTANQFYLLRFLLGVAEAGFFPGIIVFLSHWFRYEDRAKAMALFLAAIPVSTIIGSPISGLILGIDWFGIAGWRWLFILEGFPAVIFGVVTIFYLTDRPHQAAWLAEEERNWITNELEQEKQTKEAARSYRIWDALRHREVVLLALAYFCIITSSYGFAFWLPSIIKKLSGFPNLIVTLIVALPHAVGLITMLLMGWSSDRTGERRWHTTLSMLAASLGFFLCLFTQNSVGLSVLALCIAAAGLYGYLPGFWALPTSFLTGSAAAAAIGLINALGNLGGFTGPYLVGYIATITDSFSGGVFFMSGSALFAACLIQLLRQAKGKKQLEHNDRRH